MVHPYQNIPNGARMPLSLGRLIRFLKGSILVFRDQGSGIRDQGSGMSTKCEVRSSKVKLEHRGHRGKSEVWNLRKILILLIL
jgi:hypothetical protein